MYGDAADLSSQTDFLDSVMSAWIDYLYPDALLGNPKALFVQYEPSDLDSSAPLFYLQTYPGYVDWNTNT